MELYLHSPYLHSWRENGKLCPSFLTIYGQHAMSLLFLWPSRIIDIFWRDSVKPRNVSVRTPSVPCQYSIKYTLNTQPDCCTAKLFGIALLGKLESVDCANLVGFLARAGMFRVGQFSGQGRDVSCWPVSDQM